MPKRRRIKVIATGGTIASTPTRDGLVPTLSGEEVLDCVPSVREIADLSVVNPFATKDRSGLDSTNIHHEEHVVIANEIVKAMIEGYDAAAILHGTWTMAQSASAIAFMLPFRSDFRVGYTGSGIPIVDRNNDAVENVYTLMRFLAREGDYDGTYIIFNRGRKIILATRAFAAKPNQIVERNGRSCIQPHEDEFDSVNFWYVRNYDCPEEQMTAKGRKKHFRRQRHLSNYFRRRFDAEEGIEKPIRFLGWRDVGHVRLTTQYNPEEMEKYLERRYGGVVIECPGSGGVSDKPEYLSAFPVIEKLTRNGKVVIMTADSPYGIANIDYEPNSRGARAGGVLGYDTNSRIAHIKLGWACSMSEDPEDVKAVFLYPIEGEIRSGLIPERHRPVRDRVYDVLLNSLRSGKNRYTNGALNGNSNGSVKGGRIPPQSETSSAGFYSNVV